MNKTGLVVVVVCLLLGSFPLAAQNGSLLGTVKDAQEGVVHNATVTLTNQETGVSQSTKTDSSGNYEFPRLRPGNYSIKVEQPGFATYTQSPIVVAVDQRFRADANLQVGATSTLVNVETRAAGVETESSSLGSVVTAKNIAEMPLNGRFFLDLALIQAGTVAPSTNNRTFWPFPAGSASRASTLPAPARIPPTTCSTGSTSATWCRTRSPSSPTWI